MQITRKCSGCKENFRKTELVEYFSASGKTSNWYCPKCLEEKQSRERFMVKICEIFGVKSPGPRIWTERKRLIDKYGYTDNTIIDCLEYLYNIEKKDKFAESLCLINPISVEKMMQYKKLQQAKANSLIQAMKQETIAHLVPIKQNENKEKEFMNPDEWLKDD